MPGSSAAGRRSSRAWTRLHAGTGATGERFSDWALVETIDAVKQTLRLRSGAELAYDYLVIATGPKLAFEEVPVLVDAFRSMVRGLEYDVCEMAFTTYLCARAAGKPLTAVPGIVTRTFQPWAAVYHVTSGIRNPKGTACRLARVHTAYTVLASFLSLVPPYNGEDQREFSDAFRNRAITALDDLETVAALQRVLT